MILRTGTARLLKELHDELAKRTLVLWNAQSGRTYGHYVPWMSCLPRPGEAIVDHPALSDRYAPGSLISSDLQLQTVNNYLGLPQADRIALDIFKNLAKDQAQHPIAQPTVEGPVLELFNRAKESVLASDSLFRKLFDLLVHAVIPLRVSESKMNESLDLARGAVFISFFVPLDEWQIKLGLAHEFGHQALMLLNSADPFLSSDISTPVFSGVRMTDRPAVQSLHAATALAFMTLFSRTQPDSTAREATINYVAQLRKTLLSLRENCVMTEVGEGILQDYEKLCSESKA